MTRARPAQSLNDDPFDAPLRRAQTGSLPIRLLEQALRNPAVAGGALVCGLAIITIVVNALANQPGKHPSPMFSTREQAQGTVPVTTTAITVEPKLAAVAPPPGPIRTAPETPAPVTVSSVPRSRQPEAQAPAVAPPTAFTQTVERIQQGLKDRGLYAGTVDGIAGPATAEAIRAYERGQGLPPSGDVTERLLQQMKAEKARPAPAPVKAQTVAYPTPPEPLTASAEGRIQKAQRALLAAGYGPIRVDGRMDDKTADAIRRYETDRGIQVTGQVSDRLVLDLMVHSVQAR